MPKFTCTKCGKEISYSDKKVIPTVKIGVQHTLKNGLGFRVFADWKNLSKFKVQSDDNTRFKVRMRDNVGLGFGIFYNI